MRTARSGETEGAEPQGKSSLDPFLIGEALEQAVAGQRLGEVPVGAVVWLDGRVVARAFNRPINASDPTAHAEILALREAAARLGNYRLCGATLAVTLEPCLMCFGAALQARVSRVLFGAYDPRLGAARIIESLQLRAGALNHRIEISGGARAAECASLLQGFFADRR